MNNIELNTYYKALGSVGKKITMGHDGACFVSTEVLLADGTTLEIGARENEDDDGMELICIHHKEQTVENFYVYRSDCELRYLAMQQGKPMPAYTGNPPSFHPEV